MFQSKTTRPAGLLAGMAVAGALLALGSTASAQLTDQSRGSRYVAGPVITGLNATDFPRSGRIAIEGKRFGVQGQVLVAGINAWTTTWTDTRVVAYVPETAPTGVVTLQINAAKGWSNVFKLKVHRRKPDGRVKWTFETDGDDLWWRPALAPDGTIYVHTNNERCGLVYALSPDGALLWVQEVVWYPYVPPSAGPDGAVYVGSINSVYRISPQGNIDWEFRDYGSPAIQVAPTIGPDGLLYGAYETGMGAFALQPLTGQLVWASQGDPRFSDRSGWATEMRFGPSKPGGPVDQLYFHMNRGGGMYAFSLDGKQQWTAGMGAGTSHVFEPAIAADGTIYSPAMFRNLIRAIDPEDGATQWEFDGGWINAITDFDIGSDDTLYYVGGRRDGLEAFDPHSRRILWTNSTAQFWDRPTLSPDGSQLVLSGSHDLYGYPGFVKGYDAAKGTERWSVDLPFDLGPPAFRVFGVHRPRISADSTTAYISTVTLAQWPLNLDERGYLYAIDITP